MSTQRTTPSGGMASWYSATRQKRFGTLGRSLQTSLVLGAAILLIAFPILDSNQSHVNVADDAGRWVLLALGLNIVVGYAGLLDLGYAAFFAIGSYAFAILASSQFNIHISFWLLLLLSALIAALFGVILGAPTLRLRGDYLAIVTLGFGEIVPRVVRNATPLTGGVNGIVGTDQPSLPIIGSFGFNPVPYYYLILAVLLVSIYLISNLRNSRLGRAWMAIREDEVAAAATGINTVTTKLLAFAMGAAFSGFAGTYYTAKLFIVTPESFGFVVSVTVLVMVVLGGMGNMWGVIVGSLLVYTIQSYVLIQLPGWIQSVTQALNIGFLNNIDIAGYVQRSNFLIFGIILVAIMLLRPQGLIPSAQRKVELEHGTSEEAVSDLRGSA
ncbi:MAG: branched-chain amino acid ABC transporter permease [Candidatus Dormibacteraeota bacterium]|nr:branched-chain amino acid ABC transporter permease [Candidatus Dormibacteraeota bacterium]